MSVVSIFSAIFFHDFRNPLNIFWKSFTKFDIIFTDIVDKYKHIKYLFFSFGLVYDPRSEGRGHFDKKNAIFPRKKKPRDVSEQKDQKTFAEKKPFFVQIMISFFVFFHVFLEIF